MLNQPENNTKENQGSLNMSRKTGDYPINDPVFDDKFNNTRELNWITIFEIEAKNDEGKNDTIFWPGFSRDMESTKNTLYELSDNRNITSLNQPRINWLFSSNENPFDGKISNAILIRATSIFTIAEEKIKYYQNNNIDKQIDLVGQSLGWIDVVIAAAMIEDKYPDSVANLALVNSAWLVWNDTPEKLKARFSKQVSDNLEIIADWENPEWTIPLSTIENQKIAKEWFFKYLFKNPIRAMNEWNGMCEVRLEDLLIQLRNTTNIKTSIIHSVDDKTFPMNMVQTNAFEVGLSKIVNWFYSVNWTHNELFLNPKMYSQLIDYALTATNNLK